MVEELSRLNDNVVIVRDAFEDFGKQLDQLAIEFGRSHDFNFYTDPFAHLNRYFASRARSNEFFSSFCCADDTTGFGYTGKCIRDDIGEPADLRLMARRQKGYSAYFT